MRSMRWVLIGVVAVLLSCGGGSSSTTSEASSTSTVAGTDALQGDGSSSTQISPVVDCNVAHVSIDPLTPTLWDAAGYCWGADQKVIMDIIIEMNPQIDPMNLRWNQIIKLPQDYSRYEANRTRRYKKGDTGPGGGIIVYVDEAGFYNSGEGSIGAMCMRGTCHYLEMALSDLEGQYSWDDAMVAAEAFSTPSANDWLLPSQDALLLIYRFSSRGVGGFSPDYYWSSSEGDVNFAWSQRFKDGWQFYFFKYSPYYVRPVRAF